MEAGSSIQDSVARLRVSVEQAETVLSRDLLGTEEPEARAPTKPDSVRAEFLPLFSALTRVVSRALNPRLVATELWAATEVVVAVAAAPGTPILAALLWARGEALEGVGAFSASAVEAVGAQSARFS